MEKEEMGPRDEDTETAYADEFVVFQASECYCYLIPPGKSATYYRADEWDANKWKCEGALKVIIKDEECVIGLEDKTTGESFARAFLGNGEPHPVEPVIDSSRHLDKKRTAEEMNSSFRTHPGLISAERKERHGFFI